MFLLILLVLKLKTHCYCKKYQSYNPLKGKEPLFWGKMLYAYCNLCRMSKTEETTERSKSCYTKVQCQFSHGTHVARYNGTTPESHRGNKNILCVGDYFTKWVSAISIPNQEAQTVATALVEHVFSIFDIPNQLHSDLGRNFESTLFTQLCELLGVDKARSTITFNKYVHQVIRNS